MVLNKIPTFDQVKSWVNNSADVPNADHADSADNADTVDGQHYTDIQSWVNNNADVPNADHADNSDTVEGLSADKLSGIEYVQDTEPNSSTDGEIWVDTSNPQRPLHVYSTDRGEWVPTVENVPLFVTQEAVSFGESEVDITHGSVNGIVVTEVSGGSVTFRDSTKTTDLGVDDDTVGHIDSTQGIAFVPERELSGVRLRVSQNTTNITEFDLRDSGNSILESVSGNWDSGDWVSFNRSFSQGTEYRVTAQNSDDLGRSTGSFPYGGGSGSLLSVPHSIAFGGSTTADRYMFQDIEGTYSPLSSNTGVGFSPTPSDLAAWDRLSWQYDKGDGDLTFDVEVNDGTGWSVHRNDVLPPVSISEVAPTQDVRLVAKFSRQSGSDASPAVSYVARRGER
jgi:hypothetical protein